MGCGKICRAKKAAKNAKKDAAIQQQAADKQAADAKKQADQLASTTGNQQPYNVSIFSYTVEVITIGKFLGIDNKKNSISIRDMTVLLQSAKRSPEIIANAAAKNLITPILVAMGAYKAIDWARTFVYRIVKPGIKIAMQINDIVTFNFAALGELVSDVAQMIVQIILKFAPLLVEILKNLFLSIPLYVKIITNKQSLKMQTMIALSTISIKDRVSKSIEDFSLVDLRCPEAIAACDKLKITGNEMTSILSTYVQDDPLFELEDLTDVNQLRIDLSDFIVKGLDCARKNALQGAIAEVNKESINILEIPDMANETVENKKNMKDMMEGLLTVTKKTELAVYEELLRKNFVASQEIPTEEEERFSDILLAEAAADNIILVMRIDIKLGQEAFNKTDGSIHPSVDICTPCRNELNKETEKKLKIVENQRQDIISISIVEDLVQANKIQIFDNIIKSLNNVNYNLNVIDLQDCMSENINNDFNAMKTNIINSNFTTIDNAVITDTAEMILLRDQVYSDTIQAINDELITADDSCGFGDSVCENLTAFKSDLVHQIEDNMNKTTINVATAEMPDYADKYAITEMLKKFSSAINEELMVVIRAIILESVLPCKACRPCENLREDLVAHATEWIDKIKDEMIRNSGVYILDPSLDWTITDANSIIEKKQQLVEAAGTAVLTNAGVVDMYDAFVYRLKLEENEIISNIMSVIKNS